jgi:oxygen-dependent protoporphyrinogen oxidase
MGTLVDALAARLEACIRYGAELVSLARNNGGVSDDARAWTVAVADGAAFEADAVVCAAPAYAAATLIRPYNEKLASLLAGINYASAATVNMAFHAADFPQIPRGFGFVVPAAEHRKIIAGSFSSLKFAGRAPEGMILARVFLGGALQSEMMSLGDDAMLAAAREEFAALLGVTAEPVFAYVQRWAVSMPQFAVGHLEKVAEIEREAAGEPGFALAGAFLRGVGIPDCIRSGEEAAESVIAHLTSGK